MPARFTSRVALASVLPGLAGLRREVYDAILNWPGGDGPTIERLAARLGRKESSICGRIAELRDAGAIEDGPFTVNSSGHKAGTYVAVVYREFSPPPPPVDQLDFFAGAPRAGVSAYSTRP